ncbi:hypothetical protein OEA41_009294 [Lepraria neglecta]|uniref:Uncharacterized protein n=1 Tax=Lepraria neglecta TaxID=209136 RepID=A0AAD9Z1J2_9LECA|nr:hypothetical protein OEA41_009294 [Lepraria neglecta]
MTKTRRITRSLSYSAQRCLPSREPAPWSQLLSRAGLRNFRYRTELRKSAITAEKVEVLLPLMIASGGEQPNHVKLLKDASGSKGSGQAIKTIYQEEAKEHDKQFLGFKTSLETLQKEKQDKPT